LFAVADDELLRAHTRIASPPLLPELRLRLADAIGELWERSAADAPPYWAFPWIGGQAVARYLLDHPALVRGLRVLDVGTGSGVVAIAAALSGAAHVRASDIDPRAITAARANAALNAVAIDVIERDLLDDDVKEDLIVAGDVCYERPLAERVFRFARHHARSGRTVLIGDPGRAYFDPAELELLARYDVETTADLEGRTVRTAGVFRLQSASAPLGLGTLRSGTR
jgi:predicted nicotinamide N-methyase